MQTAVPNLRELARARLPATTECWSWNILTAQKSGKIQATKIAKEVEFGMRKKFGIGGSDAAMRGTVINNIPAGRWK